MSSVSDRLRKAADLWDDLVTFPEYNLEVRPDEISINFHLSSLTKVEEVHAIRRIFGAFGAHGWDCRWDILTKMVNGIEVVIYPSGGVHEFVVDEYGLKSGEITNNY